MIFVCQLVIYLQMASFVPSGLNLTKTELMSAFANFSVALMMRLVDAIDLDDDQQCRCDRIYSVDGLDDAMEMFPLFQYGSLDRAGADAPRLDL